ncbi:hypothetical protein OSB04_005831 [Centaurea solstitialis]|uniref:Uncharacterized protein n=1 Tax=Centaurea solstitialis TaxID=347529 RepID=A0AA38TUM2_9ASTR|nr:hypothetical protein OSB04_005831 [Centaurea solstitialis]
MKRKELQALCKKHDIPASSANSVLADKLSALLNKPTSRQRTCMKSAVETTDESEPADLRRQAKKVRFSPNNDLVEYELRSGRKEKDMVTETKHRRKSVAKNVAKPVVDNTNTVELADVGAQVPVRVTRSRVQGKDDAIPVNEEKQGRRAVKDVKKGTDEVKELEGNLGKVTRSKVHTLGKGGDAQLDENKQNKKAVKDVEKAGESVEGTMVGRVRVTRSKAQTLMEDSNGPNLNPQVKKKSGRRVVNDVDTAEPSKEIMDSPVRVTRSKRQTLTDDAANMVAITQVKKESGRRVVIDVDTAEPSKEIMDAPVRVTRSRRQTLTDDAASETNQELPRRKSSRTRGVEIATEDGNEKVGRGKRKKRSEESTAEVSESQHHADQESRQSRRNRVKVDDSTVLNPSVSKVEMVADRKVTRSKALLAMKSSGGNNKTKAKNKAGVQRVSKMVQQLEEPLEHAGRKNVNRRKSVIQPETADEVVPHLEEHMDRPARKDTRRKFVMQKGKGKGTGKPLVEKREKVKETEMVESPKGGTPKTLGKRKSKEQSGNLSVLDEDLKDEENVTGSGKGSSENEMKTVGSVTGSHKSKRKRGNPVIEDQTTATVYVSPVVESTRRSTRSTSKSEGKAVSYPRQNFVAEKQQESGIKTPASSLDNELPVESAVLEGHQSASQTTVSSAKVKDNSSKRSTKLSELKPSGSEEHVETFNTETGHTPAFEDSTRRLTRSAIRSEKNTAVNTTPGRFTPSGIKHRGNAGSKLFETVDNKKQQSRSTRRRQSLADDQMFSPVVTGVGDHPDLTNSRVIKNSNFRKKEKTPRTVHKTVLADTIGVSSEIIKEAEDQILQHSDDLSVSESVRLPTHITEENRDSMSEAPIVMENVTLVSADNASGGAPGEVMEVASADIEKSPVQLTLSATENETAATPNLLSGKQPNTVGLPNFEDESPSGTNLSDIIRTPFSTAEVSETMPDVQDENREVCVKSAPFSEAQVQVAASIAENETAATPNLLSGKQPNTVGLPNFEDESPSGINLSDIIRTPFPTAEVSETMPDVQNENPEVCVKSAPFSEAQVQVAASIDKSVVKSGSPDRKETESSRSGSMSERLQTDVMVEEPAVVLDVDISPEVITKGKNGDVDNNCDSISYKSKSKEVEALPEPSINEAVDQFFADDGFDAQIEKGYEQDVLITNDPLQNLSADKREVADNDAHNDDDERASAEKHLLDESVSEDNGVHDDMLQSPDMGIRDVEANGDVPLEQSTGDDVHHGFAMDENDINNEMVADQESLPKQNELSVGKNTAYVTDDEVDDGEELKSEEVMPCTSNDVLQMPILNKSDGEDDTINATKSSETDLMPSTDDNILQDSVLSSGHGEGESVDANKKHESNSNLPTDIDDDLNMTMEVERISEPSTTNDILETPISGNGIEGECDNASDASLKSYPKPSTGDDLLGTSNVVEDDSMNVSKEHERDLEPSNTKNTLEVLVSGNGIDSECVVDEKTDGQDGEAEQEQLIRNENFAMDEQDAGDDEPELAQNENMPTELEALFTSSDKEEDPVLNVAVDEVLCDNTSVGGSDSSTLKETPQTPATNENDVTDSIVDIHKDAVSKTLGGFDGFENATGVADTKNDISYCKSEQKSKESESVSLGVSNEQRTGEAGMSTVDHDLDGDKFMEDCSNHGIDEENILTSENPSREETSPAVYTKEEPLVDDSGPDHFTEEVGVHGSPIPEENLPIAYNKEEFDDAVSDPATFLKDDGVNKQEETQHASTSADWGNHSSGIDEYQKPVSANENEDVLDEIKKDLKTSGRASSSMDKSCSPAAGFVDSDTNLEKAFRNEADGKFNQDVLKADVTEEFFDWSASNLQGLFTTPTSNRSSNVKHDQGFTFSENRSCDDIQIRGSGGPHDIPRQWDTQPFDGYKTQDTATQSNETYQVSHYDEFSRKYFGDEAAGSNDVSMENKKENKP